MNTKKSVVIKHILFVTTSIFLMIPGLSSANSNGNFQHTDPSYILLAHGGGHHGGGHHGGGHHGGGHHGGGHHGGGHHGGGHHDGWYGGVSFYWSPWVFSRPWYYNPKDCYTKCYWHHGYKKCKYRCRRYY